MTLHTAIALAPASHPKDALQLRVRLGSRASVTMLAKSKTGGSSSSGGGGGFGAPKKAAPTLDEIVAGWKTRLPADTSTACPCGSGDAYDSCCRPYHIGEKAPESPERCLRSRYSAFAYRLPKHIIRTTDRTNSEYTRYARRQLLWRGKLVSQSISSSMLLY